MFNSAKALASHNLGGFLSGFESAEEAYNAIEGATVSALNTKGVTSGLFEEIVNVGGTEITVRGNVIDGVVRISDAFIPSARILP